MHSLPMYAVIYQVPREGGRVRQAYPAVSVSCHGPLMNVSRMRVILAIVMVRSRLFYMIFDHHLNCEHLGYISDHRAYSDCYLKFIRQRISKD